MKKLHNLHQLKEGSEEIEILDERDKVLARGWWYQDHMLAYFDQEGEVAPGCSFREAQVTGKE